MSMKKRTRSVLARGIAASLVGAAALAVSWGGTASANLITNGNFSANAADFGYPGQQGYGGAGPNGAPNPDIADWSFTPGPAADYGINGDTVNYSSLYTAPESTQNIGDWAFIIYSGSTLYQAASTAPGATYTLTLDAAAPYGDGGLQQLTASAIDGSLTGTSDGSTTVTPSDQEFNSYSLTFTARSDTTVIAFETVSTSQFRSPTTDVTNVSLVPAPEPTAILPLAAGLAGLGFIRTHVRRRKA